MLTNKKGIREGMVVYTSDGERLGKVVACQDDGFIVEKGIFFPRDYFVAYSEVSNTQMDDVHVALPKATITDRLDYDRNLGSKVTEKFNDRYDADRLHARSVSSADVRVPVIEEELSAQKISRENQAGVRITKTVKTEQKNITVPVTKEEIHVERVPVSGSREARPGDATFRNETITVPIREEEVVVTKRPVVKEEVRVTKTSHQENKTVSGTIRKESVDVDKSRVEAKADPLLNRDRTLTETEREEDLDRDDRIGKYPPIDPLHP